MKIFDYDLLPVSDGEEEALLHLNVHGENTGVNDEAAPQMEASSPAVRDYVDPDDGDDNILMAEMEMEIMQLLNTDGLDMDEISMDINFHKVDYSECGVLGFYSPSTPVNLVNPYVFVQCINEIEAANLRLWCQAPKGPHTPIMGMNSLKKFCKEEVWSDDENRRGHQGIPQYR